MISTLHELFGRNFAIGFLLPSIALSFGSVWLLDTFELVTLSTWWDLANENPLVSAVLLPVVLWFVGITLLALNHWIIRLKEGYMVHLSSAFLLCAGVWLLDRCHLLPLRSFSLRAGEYSLVVAALMPVVVWFIGLVLIFLLRGFVALYRDLKEQPDTEQPDTEEPAEAESAAQAAEARPSTEETSETERCNIPSLNPFLHFQRHKYEKLLKDLRSKEAEIEKYWSSEESPPEELLDEQYRLHQVLAARFPQHCDQVLPTFFGNIVRAVESYPQKMYGFEATRGWTRLLAVVPREYQQLIHGAKAEMDFLVNMWFTSWVFLLAYLLLFELTGRPVGLWVPAVAYISVRLSSRCSWDAASRWGETIKGAVDVFLPDLWKRLELPPVSSRNKEAEIWDRLSTAWGFRDPSRLPPSLRFALQRSAERRR